MTIHVLLLAVCTKCSGSTFSMIIFQSRSIDKNLRFAYISELSYSLQFSLHSRLNYWAIPENIHTPPMDDNELGTH